MSRECLNRMLLPVSDDRIAAPQMYSFSCGAAQAFGQGQGLPICILMRALSALPICSAWKEPAPLCLLLAFCVERPLGLPACPSGFTSASTAFVSHARVFDDWMSLLGVSRCVFCFGWPTDTSFSRVLSGFLYWLLAMSLAGASSACLSAQ